MFEAALYASCLLNSALPYAGADASDAVTTLYFRFRRGAGAMYAWPVAFVGPGSLCAFATRLRGFRPQAPTCPPLPVQMRLVPGAMVVVSGGPL